MLARSVEPGSSQEKTPAKLKSVVLKMSRSHDVRSGVGTRKRKSTEPKDVCLDGSREMIVTWEYTLCRTIVLILVTVQWCIGEHPCSRKCAKMHRLSNASCLQVTL